MSDPRAVRPVVRFAALSVLALVSLATGEIAARLAPRPARRAPPLHEVALNRQGFHDADHERRKPPGTYRLLCLGDSFTFARGIPLRDSFCFRIGRHLEEGLRHDGRAEGVETVSFAREGLSTAREVSLLERYDGLRYAPDVLVLGYVLNDPEDQRDPVALEALREPTLVRRPSGALAALTRSSALAARIVERVENTRRAHALKRYFVRLHSPSYPGWEQVRQSFAHLAELTQASGTHVVVAIFPLLDFPLDDLHYPFTALHRSVAELARANGFAVLDLRPVLAPRGGPGLVVAPGVDPHPSAKSHHLVARAIAAEIDRQGWLRDPPMPAEAGGAASPPPPAPSPAPAESPAPP